MKQLLPLLLFPSVLPLFGQSTPILLSDDPRGTIPGMQQFSTPEEIWAEHQYAIAALSRCSGVDDSSMSDGNMMGLLVWLVNAQPETVDAQSKKPAYRYTCNNAHIYCVVHGAGRYAIYTTYNGREQFSLLLLDAVP